MEKTTPKVSVIIPIYNAEKYLENAIKCISEIDILGESGIIITERPVGKDLQGDFGDLVPSKDYRYGTTLITLFRRKQDLEAAEHSL